MINSSICRLVGLVRIRRALYAMRDELLQEADGNAGNRGCETGMGMLGALSRVYDVDASRCREHDLDHCSLRHMQVVEDFKERRPANLKQYVLWENGQLVVKLPLSITLSRGSRWSKGPIDSQVQCSCELLYGTSQMRCCNRSLTTLLFQFLKEIVACDLNLSL